MMDYTMSAVSFRHMSSRQSCSPLNEIMSPAQLPDMYAQTPASTADDMAFAPWLFEVPPYDTPLSRASTHSDSGCVSTPHSSVVIDQIPVCNLEERPTPASIDHMARGSGYTNDQNFAWLSPNLESGGGLPQPPFAQSELPFWSSTCYEGPPLPPMDYHIPSATIPLPPFPPFRSYRTRKSMLLTTQKPIDAGNSTVGSVLDSDDSEYDDDCSTYSQRFQSGSKSSNATGSGAAPVLKLGKWDMVLDPFTQPLQRIYVCPLDAKNGLTGARCAQRFVRPEHLRRHMRTTHGTHRPHPCKVPGCDRRFSRGDNLRDHYWTHIQRGGRIGKNQKMSLAELKEILGPKEKKLIRKLKEKLHKQRTKNGCKL